MKREQLIKTLNEYLLCGKDPFAISQDLADFIEGNFKPLNNTRSERWIADTQQWIDDWIDLFPAGVKGGTKLLRSDKRICLKKMAQFRQDYPEYSTDDIMGATAKYIEEQAERDFSYTTPAVNFIQHRDKGSELASRCRDYQLNKNISETSVKPQFEKEYFM